MNIGVLTGSVHPPELEGGETIGTEFGAPSSPVFKWDDGNTRFHLIARHGIPPSIPPHMVNHRANVWALKDMGVNAVISICSSGALRSDIRAPTLAVPEDFIDMTRIQTFFDDSIHHATPILNEKLRRGLSLSSREADMPFREGGVYIQTMGPRLETMAEVRMLATFGDYVGMNFASEAGLCIEVDLPVAGLITVDNYANGVTEATLDFRDILTDARSRWETVRGILTRLPAYL
ncbi:MAG: MTAP family purine nucleoside phosphorylase [Thermoplasmatota archaeon]